MLRSIIQTVWQRENAKVNEILIQMDWIIEAVRVTMERKMHIQRMLFFIICFTVEMVNLFQGNIQWMGSVELLHISKLNKAMFQVHELTSFLVLYTDCCHFTFLSELDLDLGRFNDSHQLNANVCR